MKKEEIIDLIANEAELNIHQDYVLDDSQVEWLAEQITKLFKVDTLPPFLYEDEGEIYIGYHGDAICTEEWNEWKNSL